MTSMYYYCLAGVFAAVVVVAVVLHYVYSEEADKAASQRWFREVFEDCRTHFFAVIGGVVTSLLFVAIAFLLWGFRGALGVFSIALFLAIRAVFGSPQGHWVGPDAAVLERRDRIYAVSAVLTMILLVVATFVLSSVVQFEGFSPWPARE